MSELHPETREQIGNVKDLLGALSIPDAQRIKTLREYLGFTQTRAAELVHSKCRAWQQWEAGDRKMDLKTWELFLIKSVFALAGQSPAA